MRIQKFVMILFGMFFFAGLSVSTAFASTLDTKTITLSVDNMTCAVCPITVRKALRNVSGVKKVKTDFKTKTATVTFDPSQAKLNDLINATTKAGYPSVLTKNKNSEGGMKHE